MKPRVLLLETIDPAAMTELEAAVEVITEVDAKPIRAIMTRGKGRVTAELMDACDGLVCVARCGVGLDNVDVEGATARGIAVLNLPGSNAQTIAEHTLMLMLAVTRGLVESANAVRAGDWASRARFDRDEVGGKTVGIVGLGNIGGRVARVCAALGMRVVYTDLVERDVEYDHVPLDALLARSDVVTLHCQLDDSTRGMMDAEAIDGMKAGAVLINTARGALVNQEALTESLRSGHLAGYGADVLDVEPPDPGDPLLALPHVVITPHVGSLTRSTYREICVQSVRNVLSALQRA